MKIHMIIFFMISNITLAQADTIFNCTVNTSKVLNLKSGNKFILTLSIDKLFGTPLNTITAPSMGINTIEVGVKPGPTVGDNVSYTLTMLNGPQLAFHLNFKSRNQSPALLFIKDNLVANLSCQILN